MSWLPKSPKARRRLMIVMAVAPVLALAVGLALFGLRDSISLFYTPTQAKAAGNPVGKPLQIGGLVQAGSIVKHPGGEVEFTVGDQAEIVRVSYDGDLPDLFREGQGVVVEGRFQPAGGFQARRVLAKHDEKYMPRELQKALKEQGEWRGEGAGPPSYSRPAYAK